MTQSTPVSGDSAKISPIIDPTGRMAQEMLTKTNGARRSFEAMDFIKDPSNRAPHLIYAISRWNSNMAIEGAWQEFLLESGGANVWRIIHTDNRGATTDAILYDSDRSVINSKAWGLDVGIIPNIEPIGARFVSAAASMDVDWYLFRKFVFPEPAFLTSSLQQKPY